MPTPILTVPVDDSAFQRFVKAFGKYTEDVKEQPETWKSMNSEAVQFADIGDLISESYTKHRDLAKEIADMEQKRLDLTKKLDEELDKADKKERERHKERAKRNQEMIDQTRSFGHAAHSIIGSIVSGSRGALSDILGTGGAGLRAAGGAVSGAEGLGGVGLIGGALMTGLGAVVGGASLATAGMAMAGSYVVGQYRAAGRSGIASSVAEGYRSNLGNYFDSDQAFANLFQQENSPSGRGYLKATLGVDPNATPQEQLEQAAFGARRLMKKYPHNIGVWQDQTRGIFGDDFGLLGQGTDAELRGHFSTANKFAKDNPLTPDAIKKFQNLTIAVDNTTSAFKNNLLDVLSKGAPALTSLFLNMGNLAESIKAIGPYADKLASLLTGKTFNHIWHDLSTPHTVDAQGHRGKDVAWSSIPGIMWNDTVKGTENLFNRIVGSGEHGHAGQVSPKGAMGAAQLMPGTAADTARSLGLHVTRAQLINDPNLSRRLGGAYLSALLKRYSGDQALATAAYNAGPGAVDSWIKRFGDPRRGQISDADFAAHIPYAETRNYVARVLGGSGGGTHVHHHKHVHKHGYNGPSTSTITHTLAGR